MPETAAENEEPKKKGSMKTILVLVGMIVMLGIGFGAGNFLSAQKMTPSDEVLKLIERNEKLEAEAAAAAEGEEPKKMVKEIPEVEKFETSYYEFEAPLTTNLKGSRKFLQAGVGMSTQYDAQVIENVKKHQVAISSDILAVISGYTEEEVEGKEGRDRLANDLKRVINERLEKFEGFGGIEDVFFSTFIMQ